MYPSWEAPKIASKPAFLDQYSDLRAWPGAKIIRRSHSPCPDYLTAAFEHGPTGPVAQRNAIGQKHLLQLASLMATEGSVSVTWPPIPQDQRTAEEAGI